MEYKVPLRIIIVDPPEGVDYCLEDDEENLVSVTRSTGADISLDLEAIVIPNRRSGAPNFTGPFEALIIWNVWATSGSVGISIPKARAPGYSGRARSIGTCHEAACGSQG